MSDKVQGRHVHDDTPSEELKPGDYCRSDNTGFWFIYPPAVSPWKASGIGTLSDKIHTIEEHEDGTITVTPSILRTDINSNITWHGYLTKGVWTAA